jgi:hypothetical protein
VAAVTVICPRESAAPGSIPFPVISHSKAFENRVTVNVTSNWSQRLEVPMMALFVDFLLVPHLSYCPVSAMWSGANAATT